MTARTEVFTRQDAIQQAGAALGFWVDVDDACYHVDAEGAPTPTLQLPTKERLRRAQSLIVHLLQLTGGVL